MTRQAHPASFLAFAVEIATFVEEVEALIPPIPMNLEASADPLSRAVAADAKGRYDGLLHVFTEEERGRLERAGARYRPDLQPYLEEVAKRRLLEQCGRRMPLARPFRSIQAETIAGVHFVRAANRAATATALNRGIPRAEMMHGFTPSLVRNALDSFVRPWIAQTDVLPLAADLATAKATALLMLWRDLGGPGRALAVARQLMASGQILAVFRSVSEQAMREPRAFGRADAVERALKMLRKEMLRRCETGAELAG